MTRAFSNRSTHRQICFRYRKWQWRAEDGVTSFRHLHVSISAPANFPKPPKWIRMNLPWMTKKSWSSICACHQRKQNNPKIIQENTYETRWVIITDCLGVTKSFQNRVGLYYLIFQVTLNETFIKKQIRWWSQMKEHAILCQISYFSSRTKIFSTEKKCKTKMHMRL